MRPVWVQAMAARARRGFAWGLLSDLRATGAGRLLRRWDRPYRNGTPIDLFDRIGSQHDEIAPGMTFEAAWGPGGAVCVRHTRLEDVLDRAALVERCPRLAGRVGEPCDETIPALLFNRSFER
ncbi:MAG: ADYC domain-containing protein [Stellaceae bacterium]